VVVVDDAVPWPGGLRVRSVIELGGMKVLRLDDGSKPCGSRSASRAEVRSNHGGRFPSAASSEDRGPPRRFLASFSSYSIGDQPFRVPLYLISKAEDSYHLNIFGGPPVLPRVIGIRVFLRGSSPIYQAGEMGHRSAEQRFVTVATFEHAHDSTLSPLIGKCTDILCETIEK
jgi:hypothetical protein